jgi:hypothetical protein
VRGRRGGRGVETFKRSWVRRGKRREEKRREKVGQWLAMEAGNKNSSGRECPKGVLNSALYFIQWMSKGYLCGFHWLMGYERAFMDGLS